jgi:uncharacterized protein (TIGR03000 family)
MFRHTIPLAVAALIGAALASATPAHAQYFSRSGVRFGMGPGYSAGYWPGYYSGNQPGITIGNPYSGLSVNIGYGSSWGISPYSYAYPGANLSYYYPSYYTVPSYTYVNPPYVAPSRPTESRPTYTYATPGAAGGTEESSAPPSVAPAAGYAARMTIRVPEGARLWIDNYESGQLGSIRKFESPATLEPGHTYVYTLKAAWMQDGQEVARTKRVDVQPGREVLVDMTDPTP